MRSPFTGAAPLVGAATPALAQSPPGAWKPVEVVISGGPNSGRQGR